MAHAAETRIPCSRDTRQLVKQQKRAGEAYDQLLRKMVEQYDPQKAAETPQRKD
jgi:hypothetical protein